jgi:galactose mutarotase-like enzyme
MTRLIELASKDVTATINPSAGALLEQLQIHRRSLFTRPFVDSTPFAGWPSGGCPTLFPWAGRVWHEDRIGHFRWNDQIGEMPIHGNLYQESASVTRMGNDFAEFEMPHFRLGNLAKSPSCSIRIRYQLLSQGIRINLRVTAVTGTFPMAPGIHPFFAVSKNESWHCEINARLQHDVTARGLASLPMPTSQKEHDIFAPYMKSHIFSGMDSDRLTLANDEFSISIRSKPKNDVVVVYRSPHDHFFCLEPWQALPNAVANHSHLDLVAAGSMHEYEWEIERHR